MGEPAEKLKAVKGEEAKRIKREALGIGDRRKHHTRKATPLAAGDEAGSSRARPKVMCSDSVENFREVHSPRGTDIQANARYRLGPVHSCGLHHDGTP
jgi:hypothetical protein